MMNWMNIELGWCSVDWVSCMTCIAELMHAIQYDVWQSYIMLHQIELAFILCALCSFQCSQMAMIADDETEYFVCCDKILIIVPEHAKPSAELAQSSFQLHVDNNHTHSVLHIVHIPGCYSWSEDYTQPFPDNSPSAAIHDALVMIAHGAWSFVKK